jgi:hypothetical protein
VLRSGWRILGIRIGGLNNLYWLIGCWLALNEPLESFKQFERLRDIGVSVFELFRFMSIDMFTATEPAESYT